MHVNGPAAIDVEDTGPGLTDDQRAQVFSAFTQGDSSVRRRIGGTGLGLTISRQWVRLMSGDVVLVRTALGAGACFCLDLPLRLAPEALAKTLRDRRFSLPVIALTAHALTEDRVHCLAAGCDEYATKPVDRRSFLALCLRWLEKGRGSPLCSPAISGEANSGV